MLQELSKPEFRGYFWLGSSLTFIYPNRFEDVAVFDAPVFTELLKRDPLGQVTLSPWVSGDGFVRWKATGVVLKKSEELHGSNRGDF